MKRDMDLVRKILTVLEDEGQILETVVVEFDDYSEEEVTYHLVLMVENGLIEGIGVHSFDGPSVLPRRLTWAGHEFLDAAKDDTRWQKAKDTASKVGGVTFDLLKQILVDLAKEQLRGMIGPGLS